MICVGIYYMNFGIFFFGMLGYVRERKWKIYREGVIWVLVKRIIYFLLLIFLVKIYINNVGFNIL